MRPAPFEYLRPATLREAAAALAERTDAAALAGGQSLMPALNLRERRAGLLVDLTRLAELRGVARDGATLRIGAGEPMWTLERDPLVAAHAPLLATALATVGAPGIRSRATLGGSVAWADPTSQLPAALTALDATVVTTRRRLAIGDAFAPAGGSALERGELVVALELPDAAGAGVGLHHVRRTHITWPVAGAAALVPADGPARVALYGAAPAPVAGVGDTPQAACAAALSRIRPFDDERARAPYRARVLPVLARRAIDQATGGR